MQLAFRGLAPGAVGQRGAGGGSANRSSSAGGGVGRQAVAVEPEQGPPDLSENPELAAYRRWQDQYRPPPKPTPTATSTLIPTDRLPTAWPLYPLPATSRSKSTPTETAPAGGRSAQNKWDKTIMRQVQDQFGKIEGLSDDDLLRIAQLVKRQIGRESRFYPDAQIGDQIGLMQIDEDAINFAIQHGKLDRKFTVEDLSDPEKNIQAGVAYLRAIWWYLGDQDGKKVQEGATGWSKLNLQKGPQDGPEKQAVRKAQLEDRLKLVFAGYRVGPKTLWDARDAASNHQSWDSVKDSIKSIYWSGALNYITDVFNRYDTNPAPSSTPVPSRTPTPTRTAARPTATRTRTQ